MFVLPTFNLGVVGSPNVPPFNVTNRDTEANILDASNTPTNPAGEATIAFATDTYTFYIYDGSFWNYYNSDSSAAS